MMQEPLLSPDKFNEGRLMNMEWLVTDVTPIGSTDRAEHAILGVILIGRFFLPINKK